MAAGGQRLIGVHDGQLVRDQRQQRGGILMIGIGDRRRGSDRLIGQRFDARRSVRQFGLESSRSW